MNIMKNDTIVITQERMAGWLMFNRFHKVDEKPDLKDSNRKIYILRILPNCVTRWKNINNLKRWFNTGGSKWMETKQEGV